jgi:nicotinate (nicotinamide) nucleotide adenylyltransferase
MHDDDTNLSFIIGLDNLFALPHWREPQRILKVCNLIVVSRPGWKFESIVEPPHKEFLGIDIEPEGLKALDAGICNTLVISPNQRTNHSRSITLLRVHTTDVSSSKIREAIAQKQETQTLLPAPVKSYILNSRLYTTEHIHSES